jgi:hypothetical protein
MYVLIFIPLGLFFRMLGRDILQKKQYKNSKETYWINRKTPPSSMKWQY